MTMLKHLAEAAAAFAAIPLLIWLKYRNIKDSTIFSNDKGPQTLFDQKKNDS
jgi:hypothetical protein